MTLPLLKHWPALCVSVAVLSRPLAAGAEDVALATPEDLRNHVSTICAGVRDRPCIALVLGGGGARGSAHIGVLKALEERGIPVDMVVGTSIGSFVGGLYASGRNADDIEQMFKSANWNTGYQDNLNRSEVPNRRKRQLDDYPIHLDLGVDGSGIRLPQGFLQGQGMKSLVDQMVGSYPRFDSFDQLPIPFRAVAADVETGDEVVLESGDLATAIQISMSIPGVVRPIEIDGRMLVDGGVANNLPVSVARALGADLVIAVDIGSPTLKKEQLSSGVAILRQMTSFLVHKNVEYQKSLLRKDDIFIKPAIEGVGTLSFDRTLEAVDAGYEAANRAFDRSELLARIAARQTGDSPHRPLRPETAIAIDRIELNNNSRLADDYILDRMQLRAGDTYTPEDIQAGIDRLYGQGTIARVNSSVLRRDDQTTLGLYVGEKEWGPGYLDFKLAVEDDFSSFSRYQIGGSYRLTNLSPYGAEWYTQAQFGTDKLLSSELYWPIGISGFYLDGLVNVQRLVRQYSLEGLDLGEVTATEGNALAGIGWNSVDTVDSKVALIYSEGQLQVPDILAELAGQDTLDYRQSGLAWLLNYDSLDNASFPKHGVKFVGRLQRTRDELEDLQDYTTLVDSELNLVGSIGRHSLRGLLRYQSAINKDPLSLLGAFELGGFLNLSGNSPGALSGQHVRFASLVYTYELAANDFGAITLPLYVGLSAEAGNVWNDKSDIDYRDLIASGSAFIGWDSPLGPAFFAYGESETGERSLYLFLGVVF